MEETMHQCTLCGLNLIIPDSKLDKALSYISKLGLTYCITGETCDEFQLEVWDPDQEC